MIGVISSANLEVEVTMRPRLPILALAGLVAVCLGSCVTERETVEPAGLASPISVDQPGVGKVTMEPATKVSETVSAAAGKCAIDGMKICRTYGQDAPAEGDTKNISLQIPQGPVVAVQCRYSAQGGTLVSAKAPQNLTLDRDDEAFLAAHGFCAAPPAPPGG